MYRLVSIVLFCLSTLPILAQRNTSGKPNIINYTPNDYKAQAQNWDVEQDTSGLMYFANTGGVLEFDGLNWRTIPIKGEKIPLSLLKTPDGQLFVAGTGFIGYLDKDSLGYTVYRDLPGNDSLNISYIIKMEYSNGQVYAKSSENLIIWDGNDFEKIEIPGFLGYFFHKDELILSCAEGLFKLNSQNELVKFSSQSAGKVRRAIQSDKFGTLVVSYSPAVFAFDGDLKPIEHPTIDFLNEYMVFNVTPLPDGDIAFATRTGGMLITDSSLNPLWRIDKSQGGADNDVKAAFVDHESNLWIGANHGISKLKYPINASFFDVRELGLGTVEDIIEYQNEIYVAADNGTFKLRSATQEDLLNGIWPSFEEMKYSSKDNFDLEIVHDQLLFGGLNGLYAFDGNRTQRVSDAYLRTLTPSRINPNIIYGGFAEDVRVLKYDEEWSTISILDLPNHDYRSIEETEDGNLWVSSVSAGIMRVTLDKDFNVTEYKEYNETNGLASDRDNLIYRVKDDIVFTSTKGVFKYDSGSDSFAPDTTYGDFRDEFIYGFNSDDQGTVWANVFDKQHVFRSSIEGSTYSRNGPINELKHLQIYCISPMDDYITWLGGSNGLAKFVSDPVGAPNASNTHIRSATVDGNEQLFAGQSPSNKSTIETYQRSIRFDASLASFRNNNHQFQSKLHGFENKWSSWTTDPFRIFTNLSPGTYQYEVIGRNDQGIEGNSDLLTLIIQPYWYETIYSKMALAAVVAFVLWLLYKFFSERKLIRKVEEIEMIAQMERERDALIIAEKENNIKSIISAQENERQRIARDLHDGIVQDISSIVIRWREKKSKTDQSLMASLEEVNDEIRHLSHDMMPKTLTSMGLLPAIEGLLQDNLPPNNIQYEWDHFGITDRLDEEIEISLYRISQELIQNIIKHSKASSVSVQVFKTGKYVTLLVEDNGVGIPDTSADGIGLTNIKSRIDLLKGTLNIDDSPQKGALITIKIPIS